MPEAVSCEFGFTARSSPIPLPSPENCNEPPSFPSTSFTPTMPMVTSLQCEALILSPVHTKAVAATRRLLYRRRIIGSRDSSSPPSCIETDLNGNRTFKDTNITLGEGGFGTVFRSAYNNRDAAIKQLHQRRHSSSADFLTLCAELNAFRLPHSPFVVSILSFSSSGPVQIVCEYVHGRDLRKLMDDDSWQTTSEDRLRIASQVAKGLAHCHLNNLLHLDVKPSNVVVSFDGKISKLSDFGCSRRAVRLPNGLLQATNALSDTNFGTIAYKAPELLKGEQPTDRADVYSYSLLLYELLSRRSPFPGIHPHAIVFLTVKKHLRPDTTQLRLCASEKGLSETDMNLIDAMEQCWRPNICDRPSAVEISERIACFPTWSLQQIS